MYPEVKRWKRNARLTNLSYYTTNFRSYSICRTCDFICLFVFFNYQLNTSPHIGKNGSSCICFPKSIHMHFLQHTHTKHSYTPQLFSYLPAAYTVSYGGPMQEISLLNSTINLLPKAPRSPLSSTAPPTNSTSTSSLILVCLQLDSGWNTKVSEKQFTPLDVKYQHPEDKY